MLISVGIVYGTFWFFEGQAQAGRRGGAEVSAGGRARRKEPPAPNLQTQPFKDVYLLRQGENEKLDSYGWVDKEGGVARIPIDRAMEVMLQRGLPGARRRRRRR